MTLIFTLITTIDFHFTLVSEVLGMLLTVTDNSKKIITPVMLLFNLLLHKEHKNFELAQFCN
jgi:hypothetical protein